MEKIPREDLEAMDRMYGFYRLGEKAFTLEFFLGVGLFLYCWLWLKKTLFSSLLISVGIPFLLMLFLTFIVFPILSKNLKRNIEKRKGIKTK